MRIGPWRRSSTGARTTLSINLSGLQQVARLISMFSPVKGIASAVANKAGLNYVIISTFSEAEMRKLEDLLREQTD